MALSLGTRIGHYTILERVGTEGTTAEVYRGRDEHGRVVALKLLPGANQRSRRAAHAVTRLDHPHIVATFDVIEHHGRLCLIQEWINGGSLESDLRTASQLTVQQTVQLGRDVASALSYAHEHGILHRDIKPSNVLRTTTGTYKLVDFGAGGELQRDRGATKSGEIAGTPLYMSPEQLTGAPQTPASDLFGLGLLLYRCLHGQLPDEAATSYVQLAASRLKTPIDVPPSPLQGLLKRGLALDPAQRPQSAAEVLTTLNQLANGLPSTTAAIVCRSCGSPNLDGDAFCGSCGDYLEWTGEKLEPAQSKLITVEPEQWAPKQPAPEQPVTERAAPKPATEQPTSPGPVERKPQPQPLPPQPVRARRSEAPVMTAPPTRRLQPDDLICGDCGEGNAPTRRFCSRCGASLQTATVVPTPWWRAVLRFFRQRRMRPAGARPKRRSRLLTLHGVRALVRSTLLVAALLTGLLYVISPSMRAGVNEAAGTLKERVESVIIAVGAGLLGAGNSPVRIGTGLVIIVFGFVGARQIRRRLTGRAPEAERRAATILFGEGQRDELTRSLIIEIDQVVRNLNSLDANFLGMTVVAMIREYEQARESSERQAALLNVVTLMEKLQTHFSPWYVRHKDVIATAVAVLGALAGVASVVSGFLK